MEIDESVPEPKKTRDFAPEVAELTPRVKELAKTNLSEAVEQCLALEKQARLAADGVSCGTLAKLICDMCYEAKDWAKLNEQIVVIAKRRGQLRRTVIEMVKQCVTYVTALSADDKKDIRLQLIDTLRTVTAGKIYVEVDRARLTRTLAHIKEAEGKVAEAAELLQEVQVETYGAMEKMEKADFILDQMRLVLLKGDFIRTQIISRKITKKVLEEPDFQDVKVKYYEYMIQYYHSEAKYLDICKCYQSIFDTPKVQADPALWQPALESMVFYLVLAPFDNEQSDLMSRTFETKAKQLSALTTAHSLLKQFLTMELMPWPLPFEAQLKSHSVFSSAKGDERWTALHKRIIQHNIRVVAKYYSRLNISRLAQLLGLDVAATEQHVADMVTGKFLSAKIDRPTGIVNFERKKEANAILADWSRDMSTLLDLVENTCHLIHKETMTGKAPAAAAASSSSSSSSSDMQQ